MTLNHFTHQSTELSAPYVYQSTCTFSQSGSVYDVLLVVADKLIHTRSWCQSSIYRRRKKVFSTAATVSNQTMVAFKVDVSVRFVMNIWEATSQFTADRNMFDLARCLLPINRTPSPALDSNGMPRWRAGQIYRNLQINKYIVFWTSWSFSLNKKHNNKPVLTLFKQIPLRTAFLAWVQIQIFRFGSFREWPP